MKKSKPKSNCKNCGRPARLRPSGLCYKCDEEKQIQDGMSAMFRKVGVY